MIRSMTAFARSERQGEWGKLSWELRSVNHRYLDLHPRLPEELRFLEPVVRERAGRQLSRGKVEEVAKYSARKGLDGGSQPRAPRRSVLPAVSRDAQFRANQLAICQNPTSLC